MQVHFVIEVDAASISDVDEFFALLLKRVPDHELALLADAALKLDVLRSVLEPVKLCNISVFLAVAFIGLSGMKLVEFINKFFFEFVKSDIRVVLGLFDEVKHFIALEVLALFAAHYQ